MKPTLEILSQGEELVTGQVLDTNARWLSEQAVNAGFTVTRHHTVGDKLEDLAGILQDIAQRADCCICTGGLGPTSDDLTAEAVALAFNTPLVFDAIAYAQISQYFHQRKRPMPEVNRKQAMLPQGAQCLENNWGTAPGFALTHGRCWLVFLPGVPLEMERLFQEHIMPTWPTRFALQKDTLVTLKTIGLGESSIQERIADIALGDGVQLGFRATRDDVQTKLLFPPTYSDAAIAQLVSQFSAQLGDYVFAVQGLDGTDDDLVGVIDRLMKQQGLTLAVLETASLGLLAAKCVGVNWLISASYEQSIAALGQDRLATPENLIDAAKNLAIATQKRSGASLVLVQLYAGDHAQMHDKNQTIAVHSVLWADNTYQQSSHDLGGPIQRKQNQAALLSLDLLRRHLQNKA